MSEKVTTAVAGMGYGGYWTPFTEVQRRELEQQAMIYKYMVDGLQVPPDLVTPIQHGFDGFLTHIFNNSALGYSSYYGKKFDPEPGRCQRTDGKKWRCSKGAHPDSKYCERHMNRGRNRSRKPVESQSTSLSVLNAIPHSSAGYGSNFGSSQQMPAYSVANPERSSFGSNVTKLQMGPVSYGMNSKEISFSQEKPARVGSVGLDSSAASATWSLAPSQVSSRLQGSSYAQQYTPRAFEPINASLSKQQQQHGLFGSDIGSSATMKQEQHRVHLFLNEWPSNKESWSNLDKDGEGIIGVRMLPSSWYVVAALIVAPVLDLLICVPVYFSLWVVRELKKIKLSPLLTAHVYAHVYVLCVNSVLNRILIYIGFKSQYNINIFVAH